MPKKQRAERMSRLLRLPDGPVDISAHDPSAPPAAPGDKAATRAAMDPLDARLADLQELLYANGRSGASPRLLIVLQGMDCGKGGAIKNVLGPMNPLGCQVATFGRPTEEELAHDFLWRIRRRVPPAGLVGVFDRSHYEDVVAARVRRLVPPSTWRGRYAAINRFEKDLTGSGVRLVKVFLHISLEEQRGAAARPARQPGQASLNDTDQKPPSTLGGRRAREPTATQGLPCTKSAGFRGLAVMTQFGEPTTRSGLRLPSPPRWGID